MPRYRICKTFTVESGHMLSKHPERCRFPHGHTRKVEVVVSASSLDENDMLVDFKALSLAFGELVNRYDHAMAVNSQDPVVDDLIRLYPEGVIIFEGIDPTTEVMAKTIYDQIASILESGFEAQASSNAVYRIPPATVHLERVRVWETPSSWAEYGD